VNGTTAAVLDSHSNADGAGRSSDSSYEAHAAGRRAGARKGGSVPRPLPPTPPAVRMPTVTAVASGGTNSRASRKRGSTASAAAAAARARSDDLSGALSSSSSSSGSVDGGRRRANRLSVESHSGQLSALLVETSSSTGVRDDVRLDAAGASSVASSSAMSERYHRLQSMYRRVYKR
jgi:hypothetical protein